MNPQNIIPLGKIATSYGVKGEFLIKAYNNVDNALLACKIWYLIPKTPTAKNDEVIILNISHSKLYKQGLLAKADEFRAPEEWKKFIGCEVGIPRESFPHIDDKDEFYWVDLINKAVFNTQNKKIGIVKSMMDNGVQSILCICPIENCCPLNLNQEILIPFTNTYIKEVNKANGHIIVEWEI